VQSHGISLDYFLVALSRFLSNFAAATSLIRAILKEACLSRFAASAALAGGKLSNMHNRCGRLRNPLRVLYTSVTTISILLCLCSSIVGIWASHSEPDDEPTGAQQFKHRRDLQQQQHRDKRMEPLHIVRTPLGESIDA
jgi:hypothetical protein